MSATCRSSRILLPGSPGRPRAHGSSRRVHAGRLWSLCAILLCSSGLLLRASPAGAAEDELHVILHYAVDPTVHGCWDESEFRRDIAHRTGYEPFSEDAAVNVSVHVGGAANAVDGHVEWRKANGMLMGERRFVAKDGNCAKLLTEMSFAVSLQIDLLHPKPSTGTTRVAAPKPTPTVPAPSASAFVAPPSSAATDGTSPTETATGSVATAPAAVPAAPADHVPVDRRDEVARAQPASPSRPWAMWMGLGPALAWRLSPRATGDARIFWGIRRAWLSLEIAADATYPSTDRRWDGSGFRQMLWGFTLGLCGHHEWASACVLGRAVQARVTGLGVDKPQSPTAMLAQTGLRAAATLPLGTDWSLAGHVDGLVAVTSSRVLLNQATMWEMPRLGTVIGIDLAVRFR